MLGASVVSSTEARDECKINSITQQNLRLQNRACYDYGLLVPVIVTKTCKIIISAEQSYIQASTWVADEHPQTSAEPGQTLKG